jgi:tetratricopeptide (TPR) repeat protein
MAALCAACQGLGRARSAAAIALVVSLLFTYPAQAQTPERLIPPEVVQRIAELLDRNDLAAAKSAVTSALRQYAEDPALHNFAGVIDAQQGAYESAESHFQTAIRLAPRAVPPYENLGRLYQEHAGVDPAARTQALDIYRRLLEFDPTNAEALYQSAFLLMLDGKFAQSRAFTERLPPDVLHRPQTLAVLATDRAGLGDTHGAATAVAELSNHPDLSVADVMAVQPALDRLKDDGVMRTMLEALDRRGLASPDVLLRLGGLHMQHQRFAEARAVLERAAVTGPSVPILVELARAADKLGDHEGALGYLAHARTLDPNNSGVHLLFGIVCVEMNLVAEAYESLKKAVTLDPENPFINYAMGAVSIHRHEPAEALPYFEKYIRLKPDDSRGRLALGVARFYSNQFVEARQDLQQATQSPETAVGAHYFLARIARQDNDLAMARQEIDETIRRNSQFADAWAERGLIQTRAGQYKEAEESLSKALAIDPENYQATVNLTALYGRTKDPRREAQVAALAALQEKREQRAQEFLRMIEVVP